MGINTVYYDKNGDRIRAGMTLKHDSGKMEMVYSAEGDLGIDTTSRYETRGIVTGIESLSSYDLNEWEILKYTLEPSR